MQRRGWIATAGGSAIALLTGGAAALANIQSISDALVSITHVATVGYVDKAIDGVAKVISADGGRLSALANLVSDQMIFNLENQLTDARHDLVAAQRTAVDHPDIESLALAVADAQGKVDDLTSRLQSAKCYRVAIHIDHAGAGCSIADQ